MRTDVSKPTVCRIESSGLSLSAIRLMDHVLYGQVLHFDVLPEGQMAWERPEAFVDLCFLVPSASLNPVPPGWHTGLTLWDALQSPECLEPWDVVDDWTAHLKHQQVQRFLWRVSLELRQLGVRKAVRSMGVEFVTPLPWSGPDTCADLDSTRVPAPVFPGLRNRVVAWLLGRASETLKPRAWRDALKCSGLDPESIRCSGLQRVLDEAISKRSAELWSGSDLLKTLDFSASRISVIPVAATVGPQIKLEAPACPESLPPTRRHRRALKPDATAQVVQQSKALGLRLERISAPSLWGTDVLWEAVTHRGNVLEDGDAQQVFDQVESAEDLLFDTAQKQWPRLAVNSRWQHIGWSAGEMYREWLITLPWHQVSFHGPHFPHRNVLAHVRTDIRETEDGRRMLLLQEVQSDWARSAHRHKKALGALAIQALRDDIATVPFLKDWLSLVLKLMVLHAVGLGLDGVAWTTGLQQSHRHGRQHLSDLALLYDQVLLAAAVSMFKELPATIGQVELYLPQDFSVLATPQGHRVFDANGNDRGIFETLDAAWHALPNGATEKLVSFHAVWLDDESRATIRHRGFDA